MLPKGGDVGQESPGDKEPGARVGHGRRWGTKERGGDVLCGDPWGPLRAKAPYLITGSIALNSSVPAFSSTS